MNYCTLSMLQQWRPRTLQASSWAVHVSGHGIGREAGKLGLEEYLEVKVVSGWND